MLSQWVATLIHHQTRNAPGAVLAAANPAIGGTVRPKLRAPSQIVKMLIGLLPQNPNAPTCNLMCTPPISNLNEFLSVWG